MTETDFRTYKKLLNLKELTENSIPKSVLNSAVFLGLLDSNILKKTKVCRGFRFEVSKTTEFELFFRTYFPEDIVIENKSDNVRKYRNSKTSQVKSKSIFMLRGFNLIDINNKLIDINYYTENYGLFACTATTIKTDKICFVENLDTFLVAEKLMGKNFLYIHKYGRIGKDSLSIFDTKEILVFVDYDFNGLDEFLRIKEVFSKAELFIPDNYNELFTKYSQSLKGNKAEMTKRVKETSDKNVIMIRESVARNNRFLEQQYWKYD